ncbi:MAG TPA: glycosyltransferase family 39 protein [Bryobacteraceae bacterium]|nr:glycosyltransferase family 39 protein [Bryobacteraceae bacterium]
MLSLKPWKLWTLVLFASAAFYALYFLGLTRTGLLGPDEPRYAAIGQAMAASGDWITPRLWEHPWFEKPALLYWTTALGFRAGLDPDLAPRLPVAVAGVVFLVYFFVALRREFGAPAALYAMAILATSAGWLAFSRVAVTDLPMAAAFAASMLALLGGRPLVAGVLLGLAVLAKGLVPLALFLPALWFFRDRVRALVLTLGAAVVIAAPWYILVTLRNGMPFLEDFFWKQHFARFVTGALQHEQPFWFYVPVLVAGIFPWSPLLLLLGGKHLYKDHRAVFLAVWLVWGFLFFSVSRNKLPGYLLPLLPAAAALIGVALEQARRRSAFIATLLASCAALLWFVPTLQELLPQALLAGISHAAPLQVSVAWLFPVLAAAAACIVLEKTGHRAPAVALVAVLMTLAVVRLVWQTYPVLDRTVSARSLWRTRGGSITCVPRGQRSLRYGLDYYAGRDLPDCN